MRVHAFMVAIALMAGAGLPAAPVVAEDGEDKCSAVALATKIHEAMRERGETDADIHALLTTLFTRRIIQSSVAERTGCSEDETKAAITRLEVATQK